MLEAFFAVFITAIIFTVYTFLIIEEDLKRKSERVIYIMLIVIVAWFVSTGLLVTPSTSTTITSTPAINYSYYYLTPTNSMYNASDMFYFMTPGIYSPLTQITSVLPAVKGHFKIYQSITYNSLYINDLSSGLYQVHLHAATNDTTSSTQLYSQIWVIGANDDNLFMLGQTGLSQVLQPHDSEYVLNFYINQTTVINPSDRLALFIFANYTDNFGQPVNVTLYMGDFANAHISVPSVNPQFTTELSSATMETSTPLPGWVMLDYDSFAFGIDLLFIVFFIKYMLEYGLKVFIDGLKSFNRGKK